MENTLSPEAPVAEQPKTKTAPAVAKDQTKQPAKKLVDKIPVAGYKTDLHNDTSTSTKPGISPEVITELSKEINNMLSFAIYNGITINTEINSLVQNSTVDDLINAHNLLCKNVMPATPKSIEYTRILHQEGKDKALISKLPLIRNLILLAFLFLCTFIGTGLFPEVNNNSLDQGILSEQNSWDLFLNISFLASVSGLGVIFYLLKHVSTSVRNGTLIPEDAVYYVALVVLGLISGLLMSEVISLYTTDPKGINLVSKSVLALVGGFSSDAIFSVLQGIINKIKSLFPVNK